MSRPRDNRGMESCVRWLILRGFLLAGAGMLAACGDAGIQGEYRQPEGQGGRDTGASGGGKDASAAADTGNGTDVGSGTDAMTGDDAGGGADAGAGEDGGAIDDAGVVSDGGGDGGTGSDGGVTDTGIGGDAGVWDAGGTGSDGGVADTGIGSDAGVWDAGGGRYHPVGWVIPTNHGTQAKRGLGICRMCHGADLAGGTAGVSCNQCHNEWKTDCTFCHGGKDDVSGAPPYGIDGDADTSALVVGAHRTHLKGGAVRAALTCDSCHIVPVDADSPGHIDNPTADVTWGALSTTGGAAPQWDRAKATCSAVYCHGATIGGGTNKEPAWTTVDSSQAACGTCHGSPPPAPHLQDPDCNNCHDQTVKADGTIDLAGAKHINGTLDFSSSGMTCTTCHGGGNGNAAPPAGVHGETLETQKAVGAHQIHLGASTWHRDGQCADCHATPGTLTHSNGVTDFTWGAVAKADAANPSYASVSATCSSVYCHGTTLMGAKSGGTVKRQPVWTQSDGAFKACGTSCHTNPPGGTHPEADKCENCHSTVAGPGGTFVDRTKHIDGTVELSYAAGLTCTSCHGGMNGDLTGAPPTGLLGETATADVAVGAHQKHLHDGLLRAALACGDCHTVPTTVGAAGHIDAAPAEMTFGALSKTDGAAPAWDRGTAKCSSVYCHGATITGGTNKTPLWTKVDGTQAACGTCHGSPPPAPHLQDPDCNKCHDQTVKADQTIDVAAGNHVNGQIDFSGTGLTCTTCHGGTNGNAAPPIGVHGETLTTQKPVGAHQAHLGTNTWRRTGQCADCHAVPASMGHSNGVTDFTWGTVVKADAANPSYTSASATCSSVYCHGTTLMGAKSGGTVNRTPVWTQNDGTFKACGTSCHTNPPGGTHTTMDKCSWCHFTVINAAGTITGPALHVNGTVDVSYDPALTCSSCHGGTDNATGAPPKDVAGLTATSSVTVGAHTSHVSGTHNISAAYDCGKCHVKPATAGAAGHIDAPNAEVVLEAGAVWARTGGGTCSTGYCHGNFTGGIATNKPVWTTVNGTYAACGTCHRIPPLTALHPMSGSPHEPFLCYDCHNSVMNTSSNAQLTGKALHVNGTKDVVFRLGGTFVPATRTCTPQCHQGKVDPVTQTWQ